MKKNPLVTMEVSGARHTHLPAASGNYATLCGLDGDDPSKNVQQRTLPTLPTDRVDCPQCMATWALCWKYRRPDMDSVLLKRIEQCTQ